ncbi:MAG: hypothetical protein GY814_05320 [Gammaproteobacteria bacterium]|nr:hypothetical protein [Gammaproteobacteria bacterium]
MFEYEDISGVNSSKAVAFAKSIIKNGWTIQGYPTVRLDEDIPWKLEKQELRSWNYRLHCLVLIDPFLKAYSVSRNKKYLTVSVTITLDWVKKHGVSTGNMISPFAWYDMSIGMRAYRLAYLFDAAESEGLLDEITRDVLWSSLEKHALYLANDVNISFDNNHGYYQVVGQIAMGRRFADNSPMMSQALEQGRERFRFMVKQQFASDGVHREHSPDYHRMVYSTLRMMIESGLVDDAEIIAFARPIEEALSWFVFPNQHIVNFGDSHDRSLACSPKAVESKWLTPEMQFWVSGGKVGEPPKDVIRTFQEGGYWVARKSGADPQKLETYSYLALNAAFHSRIHKHADDLSFVWFDRGFNILVDAGCYGYIGKTKPGSKLWREGNWYSDPWRVYCESTRAHNTLEFNGCNFPRKGAKFYGSALKRWGEGSSGIVFVEAQCKHFESIRHVRMLFFMPGKWLIVFDWFQHDASFLTTLKRWLRIGHGLKTIKQWFHIGYELKLSEDQGGYIASVHGSQQPLRILSLLPEPTQSCPYIGEEEPALQGWCSPKYRATVPNYAFCYELSKVSSGVFASLFSFSDQLQADKDWSEVSGNGKKGRFRWKDESGTHELLFERPAKGDLSVNYSVCK